MSVKNMTSSKSTSVGSDWESNSDLQIAIEASIENIDLEKGIVSTTTEPVRLATSTSSLSGDFANQNILASNPFRPQSLDHNLNFSTTLSRNPQPHLSSATISYLPQSATCISSPAVILLFSWTNASSSHVSKYTCTYSSIFPTSTIHIIPIALQELLFYRSSTKASRLAPLIEIVHSHPFETLRRDPSPLLLGWGLT
ncbi:hypothetical protein BKA61DRAFT_136976 [Leptodontidium sp. MPI-SDFR-AT-0119]|nr:hypothetical protein BKA61DRAFT_136976 [Leptodontidium sp. MPI-SDFR-AT-0119]